MIDKNKLHSSGCRVGDWFLWFDVRTVEVGDADLVIVTARRAVQGGDIIDHAIAHLGMVESLRTLANNIEHALADVHHPIVGEPEGGE